MLSRLRKAINIIESHLSKKKYEFDYQTNYQTIAIAPEVII